MKMIDWMNWHTAIFFYNLQYLGCSIPGAVQVVVGLVQGLPCFFHGLLSRIQRLLGVIS